MPVPGSKSAAIIGTLRPMISSTPSFCLHDPEKWARFQRHPTYAQQQKFLVEIAGNIMNREEYSTICRPSFSPEYSEWATMSRRANQQQTGRRVPMRNYKVGMSRPISRLCPDFTPAVSDSVADPMGLASNLAGIPADPFHSLHQKNLPVFC